MTTSTRSGPVRLGLIGLGTVAHQIHLPLLTRRSDLFNIVGIVDVDPAALERTGRRWGIERDAHFQDVASMVDATEIDALLVMNSGQHSDSVITGLNQGLAVLCEKPLAYSHAEVNRVHAALKSGGGSLLIGYMKTHDPAVRQAKDFIGDRGARAIDIEVVHPSEARQLLTGELAHQTKAPASGLPQQGNAGVEESFGGETSPYQDLYSGVLLGSIIHEFSVLRALGTPLCLVDHAQWIRDDGLDASVIIVGTGPSGESITIRWYYVDRHHTYRETVHWIGEDFDVSIEFPTPYVLHAPTIATMRKAAGAGAETITFTSHRSAFEVELEEFAAAVGTDPGSSEPCSDAEADVNLAQQVVQLIAGKEGVPLKGELAAKVAR